MKNPYYKLPRINPDFIRKQDYFFLFETSLFDKDNFRSYIFINPLDIIKINNYQNIEEAFKKIERYSKKYYLAGYFSYELGYFFEKNSFKLKSFVPYPLIHICVFKKPVIFDHRTGKTNIFISNLFIKKQKAEDFYIRDLRFTFKRPLYLKRIRRIKEYIKQGHTYQVNFTAKFHFDFQGSGFSFYQDLKDRQNVSYGAFCKLKDEYIISLSPELFLKREGHHIYSKPMKGTIKRGRNIWEDKDKIRELKQSLKNRAENLMIVDLIRNDLGRISKVKTVKVNRLFKIEKYNTLFQMTSTVAGTLKKDITYFDIFRSIFPGGSVTGAPKIRTMQIIKELEGSSRNIYCGALGIISPPDKAILNLPIRTISITRNKGEMGVGGGIVYDSYPNQELQECLLKAKFLTDRYKPFELLETMLWNGNYRFLNEHLKRMQNSAQYFDFSFKRKEIIKQLKRLENNFNKVYEYRVRLLLDREGKIKTEYSKISKKVGSQNYIAISKYRINPERIFWYHKTTNRRLYDEQYRYYLKKGYLDVIFMNKRNEITEGTISNIVIKKGQIYYTPPVSSGLLPGILRQELIKKNKVREKVLFLKDLKKADRIFLCNSVRGLTQVEIK